MPENSDNFLNFVGDLIGDHYLKVEEDLGNGFVRLNLSEAQRRQAKHDIRYAEDVIVELLRNSRDAGCSKIFISFHKEEDYLRKITTIDDGCGIPAHLHDEIFQPRVTSKLENIVLDKYGVHGRGMALYSVKLSVERAQVVSSFSEKGSVFKIEVDTRKLPERQDQSTFPKIHFRQGKPRIVAGPNNVLRHLIEFNLEYPHLEIYLGSPSEILSTMYHLYTPQEISIFNTPNHDVINSLEHSSLKLWQYTGCAIDIPSLLEIARKYYGFEISERNAHRIINAEIKPLLPLMSHFKQFHEFSSVTQREISIETKEYAKYLGQEDLDFLVKAVMESFEKIGRKYFLKIQEQPKILREKNQIKIIFVLEEEDEG